MSHQAVLKALNFNLRLSRQGARNAVEQTTEEVVDIEELQIP